MSSRKLRVLYAASEVAGFAKTGGLADVASSLPRALAGRGVEVVVIAPLYRACRTAGHPLEPLLPQLNIPIAGQHVEGRLWRSRLPDTDVPVFFVDQPGYFDRDDPLTRNGLYTMAGPKGEQLDYPDNCARYTYFSRAVLETCVALDYWPDLIHVNDWQTGLVPLYLREIYAKMSRPVTRGRFAKVRTVFTIHNLAYQGIFGREQWATLDLPEWLFNFEQLEFHGFINLLKAGIVNADALTTVSPTYAREIQTVYYGCGLQGVLLRRSNRLTGIVNGIDDRVWNPAADRHLAAKFTPETSEHGKATCKQALQRIFGLNDDPSTPLFGIVSRLASQKGLDLVAALVPKLVERKAQLVVLGMGDPKLQGAFRALSEKFPKDVGVCFMLDEAMAHRIEAGADAFLMPSQYEPCGLNQLYSLRYGTVPIVRATGGLVDTVIDATPENLGAGRATGFSFVPFNEAALFGAIDRALKVYRDTPETWKRMIATGMRQDWSWSRSAGEYQALYEKVLRGEKD
jgi:starch synthase